MVKGPYQAMGHPDSERLCETALFDRQRVGRRTDSADDIKRRRGQEKRVTLVVGAIVRQCLKLPQFPDLHAEKTEQVMMQADLVIRIEAKRYGFEADPIG